ncbi:MAG: ABC transporter substrate-binding protein [Pseudomonadota bacterium]
MKKFILLLSAALMSITAHAAAPKAPDQVAQDATTQLLQLLTANHVKYKADSKLYYKTVNDVVVPLFDVPYIGRLVLGRNGKTATDEQRTRFQNAFKDMLIRSYANAMLDNFDSVKVSWQPLRMAAGATDVTVSSTLLREGKQPVPVGFAMRLTGTEWKIYDITVENISLVINFRSQINEEIKKNGLDSVIARMESGEYSAKPKS